MRPVDRRGTSTTEEAELPKSKSRRTLSYSIVVAVAIVLLTAAVAYSVKTTQDSRKDVLVRSCVDQNARHDAAIEQLDQLYANRLHITVPQLQAKLRFGQTPEAGKLRDSRASTVLLINALVPKRPNCEVYASHRLAGE